MVPLRPILVLLSFALVTLFSPPSFAKKLGSPTFYALAKKNLNADTMLGPETIYSVSTTESDSIPARAMWLTTANEAYGYRIHHAVAKDCAVTGDDLLAQGYSDPTPKASDPLWLKYAKSAVVCDRRGEFALSRRYEQGALVELEKLGKAKKRLQYMDDEHWVFEMQAHGTEQQKSSNAMREEMVQRRNALQNPSKADDIKDLEKKMAAMKAKMADDRNKDRHSYAVLATVLPPTSQILKFISQRLERDAK